MSSRIYRRAERKSLSRQIGKARVHVVKACHHSAPLFFAPNDHDHVEGPAPRLRRNNSQTSCVTASSAWGFDCCEAL